MEGLADFHTHSNCSDGELSPWELVALAAGEGIQVLALTDHDTAAGVEEAAAAGKEMGVRVIPGIEITFWDGKKEGHLLGLGIDPQAASLQRMLEWGLRLRVLSMLGQWGPLAPLGEGGREPLRSPKALARRHGLTPEEAAAAICQSGGLPVIPHIHLLGEDWEQCCRLTARLVKAGAVGMEVFHSGYDELWKERARLLCRVFGLLPFGGSDFHFSGGRRPLGKLPVPASWAAGLPL